MTFMNAMNSQLQSLWSNPGLCVSLKGEMAHRLRDLTITPHYLQQKEAYLQNAPVCCMQTIIVATEQAVQAVLSFLSPLKHYIASST